MNPNNKIQPDTKEPKGRQGNTKLVQTRASKMLSKVLMKHDLAIFLGNEIASYLTAMSSYTKLQ